MIQLKHRKEKSSGEPADTSFNFWREGIVSKEQGKEAEKEEEIQKEE